MKQNQLQSEKCKMKSLFNQSNPLSRRAGFTLVELLIAMAVIGILVGMLTVGVQRVFVRAQEFTIQNEVTQLGSAIEQFKTKFGFYPPSFKGMEDAAFLEDGSLGTAWSNDGIQAAGDWMLSYLGRIAPNHVEGAVIPDGSGGTLNLSPRFAGERFVDRWVFNVGQKRLNANPGSSLVGSDLVFWLSGIVKNKQRPLTQITDVDGDGTLDTVLPFLAHNKNAGDTTEREVFYDFDENQLVFIEDPTLPGIFPWAAVVQPAGDEIPYLYLDRNHYFPSARYADDPTNFPNDGAYCRANSDLKNYGGVDLYEVLQDGGANNDLTIEPGSEAFDLLYPRPDSFQLITFGRDGLPGDVDPQNQWSGQNVYQFAGPASADNMVNFSSGGTVGRLDNLIIDEQ